MPDTTKTIIKDVSAVIKLDAPGDADAVFVISTGDVDRDNDIVNPKGWDLKHFKKNPVVLYGHNYGGMPVGKALRIAVEDDKLVAAVKFSDEPEGQKVKRLVKGGFLNATSVGFQPKEHKRREDEDGNQIRGTEFLKQELWEFSIVPVPSNRQSLALLRSKGAPDGDDPLDGWTEEDGVMVPRTAKEIAERREDGDTKDAAQPKPGSYEAAHPDSTPLDDIDAPWDGQREWFAAADTGDNEKSCEVMCAWSSGEGNGLGEQRLIHHRASDGHAVVFRGVVNAAGRLCSGDIPAADLPSAKAHLGKHYREFGRVPPWDANPDAWQEYENACKTLADTAKSADEYGRAKARKEALALYVLGEHAEPEPEAEPNMGTLKVDVNTDVLETLMSAITLVSGELEKTNARLAAVETEPITLSANDVEPPTPEPEPDASLDSVTLSEEDVDALLGAVRNATAAAFTSEVRAAQGKVD